MPGITDTLSQHLAEANAEIEALRDRCAGIERENENWRKQALAQQERAEKLSIQFVTAQREAAHWKGLVSSADLVLNPFKQT